MIQIGFLRDWVTQEGTKQIFFKSIKGLVYPSLRELFDNIEADLGKHLQPDDQQNLFYTVAHHLEGQRKFSSWQAQDIIPFDLDGIDLDRIDEYPPLLAKVLEIDLDKTAIVYSGNGCHVLVQVPLFTDNTFIKKAKLGYRQLLDRMGEACEEAGLPLDKDTTAWDYARILRVPFTRNIKNKKNKETGELETIEKFCTLKYNGLVEQTFNVPVLDKPRDIFSLTKGSFPDADISEVVSGCNFFKWLKDSPDEVHEPHAYAMLSITGHFNDDNKTSSEYWDRFSSPSINSKELGEFTEQALATAGPRKCEGIEQLWGKCSECPNYKKVTSPIMLKDKNFIGTESMGFTLTGEKGGKVRQYDDLVNYFKREYNYKHIASSGDIYVYNKTHYVPYLEAEVKKFANDMFSGTVKETERVEYLRAVEAGDITKLSFLSKTPEGKINLSNGVLDIATSVLHPHDKEFNFTYCLPYCFDSSATCPTWDAFLKDVTLDRQDLIDILEEYLGYCIYGGEYLYHKALILSGGGKNGKSTFVDVLGALMGEDNTANVPLVSIGNNAFNLAEMQRALVNISEEEPPTCFKETGTFKNLTGNNTVMAQRKFKNPFKFLSKAKIVITYNEMPFIADTSTGMRRRLLIVPFDLDLENNASKVNTNIHKELEGELEGIFNRALAGYKRLTAQGGFTRSLSVEKEIVDVMESSNTFYLWYGERIVVKKGSKSSLLELYLDYRQFIEDSGERNAMGRRKFTQEIKNKKIECKPLSVKGYTTRCAVDISLKGLNLTSDVAF